MALGFRVRVVGVIWRLFRDNGKENGNYYLENGNYYLGLRVWPFLLMASTLRDSGQTWKFR